MPDKLIIWPKQLETIQALSNDGLLSKLMNYTASITDYLILLAKQQMYYSTCLGLNDCFSPLEKANKSQAENDPPVHATIKNYPIN